MWNRKYPLPCGIGKYPQQGNDVNFVKVQRGFYMCLYTHSNVINQTQKAKIQKTTLNQPASKSPKPKIQIQKMFVQEHISPFDIAGYVWYLYEKSQCGLVNGSTHPTIQQLGQTAISPPGNFEVQVLFASCGWEVTPFGVTCDLTSIPRIPEMWKFKLPASYGKLGRTERMMILYDLITFGQFFGKRLCFVTC